MNNNQHPTSDERRAIIAAATETFRRCFYNPTLDGLDLDSAVSGQTEELLTTESFASDLTKIFARSGAQPIEIFPESERKVGLSRFLKATLFETAKREYIFRDIHIDGRARRAGIRSGDRIISVNSVMPVSEDLRVSAHREIEIVLENRAGLFRTLSFPAPSSQEPRQERNVEFQKLFGNIGHLRSCGWPGILGFDVARETDAAVQALKCERLVVDLRGNFGSVGAGNLRLMSYLTPEKIPVGYSLTRRRAEEGYDRGSLTRFERIPRWKIQGLPILWGFRKLDKSIVVVTEGLGQQAFHGNIVVLVNRHTVSGAEIVAQFAKEHRLAVIVGERTAGRSLSFRTFELPYEYRFTLPIGDYIPWSGARFERCGVEPDVSVEFSLGMEVSEDRELATAIETVKSGQGLQQHSSK